MTKNPHLESCRTCRELDELWNQLFGEKAPAPRIPVQEPEWKRAPAHGTAARPPGVNKRGRALAPQNTCPGCGHWKNAKYETCFGCSGMTLCASCGVNYHSEEYDECYQCHQGEYGEYE